jgi:hypothetical protein
VRIAFKNGDEELMEPPAEGAVDDCDLCLADLPDVPCAPAPALLRNRVTLEELVVVRLGQTSRERVAATQVLGKVSLVADPAEVYEHGRSGGRAHE